MIYTLVNARNMHRKHPDTFAVPEPGVIARLRIGDKVKLIFQAVQSPGERLWVEITAINDHEYEGKLANQPLFVEANTGDRLFFDASNIADVWWEEAK